MGIRGMGPGGGPGICGGKEDLYRAIDRLDYPYKVIIIQKYFFDCKLNDIAELLEMPLGTVKVYHARAKEKLKRYLESRLSFGPGSGT